MVDRALKAAQNAGRQIEISAVEKNPHAFIGWLAIVSFSNSKITAAESNRLAGTSEFVQRRYEILAAAEIGRYSDQRVARKFWR